MGLAEWIIDDTCLVAITLEQIFPLSLAILVKEDTFPAPVLANMTFRLFVLPVHQTDKITLTPIDVALSPKIFNLVHHSFTFAGHVND